MADWWIGRDRNWTDLKREFVKIVEDCDSKCELVCGWRRARNSIARKISVHSICENCRDSY